MGYRELRMTGALGSRLDVSIPLPLLTSSLNSSGVTELSITRPSAFARSIISETSCDFFFISFSQKHAYFKYVLMQKQSQILWLSQRDWRERAKFAPANYREPKKFDFVCPYFFPTFLRETINLFEYFLARRDF